MDTTQNSPENRGSERIGLSPNLALWASAFVLIGLIILAFRATGRLLFGRRGDPA